MYLCPSLKLRPVTLPTTDVQQGGFPEGGLQKGSWLRPPVLLCTPSLSGKELGLLSVEPEALSRAWQAL